MKREKIDVEKNGKTVLICEDDLESIFSAIFLAYELKLDSRSTHIVLDGTETMEFFTEYIYVDRDEEKAGRVAKGIRRRFGENTYEHLMYVLCNSLPNRVDVFYHLFDLGLSLKYPETVFHNLGNPYVMEGFEMKRRASREIMHLLGFLRFEELHNGVLFAKIHPKSDCLLFIARHFADRFPSENFVIYDMKRKKCIIHPYRQKWYLRTNVELEDFTSLEESDAQQFFEMLFKEFCKTIAIDSRKNEKLQQNMLPLHYRDCMVEFKNK